VWKNEQFDALEQDDQRVANLYSRKKVYCVRFALSDGDLRLRASNLLLHQYMSGRQSLELKQDVTCTCLCG